MHSRIWVNVLYCKMYHHPIAGISSHQTETGYIPFLCEAKLTSSCLKSNMAVVSNAQRESKQAYYPKYQTGPFNGNTYPSHLSTTGIPEGISRYSHRVFRPRVWDQYFSCCRCFGGKGHWASCDLGQDVERKWPLGLAGALWADRAGSLHPPGGEGAGERHQADVTLWEAVPW